MSDLDDIRRVMAASQWFDGPGAYALVDGAYGSTGKGAAAALIGMLFGKQIDVVTTNAGPNSGHTGFHVEKPFMTTEGRTFVDDAVKWSKVVTQQIPVCAAVTRALYPMQRQVAYLNAGAVIDARILETERLEYGFNPRNLLVHPNAALIDGTDDADSTAAIASTNKGVGRAIARKVMREESAVASYGLPLAPDTLTVGLRPWNWQSDVVFVETAQGFSLGINQGFYPYCTSRECTVGQALADAAIPASRLRKVLMTLRTWPIRVGNTDKGTSGGWYPDQEETTWEALGVVPELTTVTKRVRRVASWSWQQFEDAVRTNEPDGLWVGFMDYVKEETLQEKFLGELLARYGLIMGKVPDFILGSFGPLPSDVKLMYEG